MRIVAPLEPFHQARITAFIKCTHLPEPEPIQLLIDTGCSKTCILDADVIRLRISYSNLPLAPNPIRTANGEVYPLLLSGVRIFIPVKYGFLNRNEGFFPIDFQEIHILPPARTRPQQLVQLQKIPYHLTCSLIGMDILRIFSNWRFRGTSLILDE